MFATHFESLLCIIRVISMYINRQTKKPKNVESLAS